MARFDTSLLVAHSTDQVRLVNLVELELDDPTGTLRLTDAPIDLEHDGETYTRAGHLLNVGDVEETAALLINTLAVTLSGVDQAFTALLLSEAYIDRTLRVHRGILHTNRQGVSYVYPIFEGRINKPAIAEDPEGGTCTVALEASSAWVDFERSPGRRTNHDQQQQHFPGDLGFAFASEIFRDLPWGRA